MLERLHLGCGYKYKEGWLNVDIEPDCNPDLAYDLNDTPWPFEDNSFWEIYSSHFFEHLRRETWFKAFKECARVLKVGGEMTMIVPDSSNDVALGFRDHHTVFTQWSFHGIQYSYGGASAWAVKRVATVPLKILQWWRIPMKEYQWMRRFPPLLRFCGKHMRNFVLEQVFIFQKIDLEGEKK